MSSNTIQRITSYMLSKQPDQTSYVLNKMAAQIAQNTAAIEELKKQIDKLSNP